MKSPGAGGCRAAILCSLIAPPSCALLHPRCALLHPRCAFLHPRCALLWVSFP